MQYYACFLIKKHFILAYFIFFLYLCTLFVLRARIYTRIYTRA